MYIYSKHYMFLQAKALVLKSSVTVFQYFFLQPNFPSYCVKRIVLFSNRSTARPLLAVLLTTTNDPKDCLIITAYTRVAHQVKLQLQSKRKQERIPIFGRAVILFYIFRPENILGVSTTTTMRALLYGFDSVRIVRSCLIRIRFIIFFYQLL